MVLAALILAAVALGLTVLVITVAGFAFVMVRKQMRGFNLPKI